MKNKLFLLLIDKNPAAAKRLEDCDDNYFYFQSPLPVTEDIIITEEPYRYTLQSHTLIVQSEILTFIFRSAYYSYSAIFINNLQQTFELQVRFDTEDRPIPDVRFSIIENDVAINIIDLPDSLISRLIQLAKNHSQATIGTTRKQLFLHTTKLFERLKQKEEYVIQALTNNHTGHVAKECIDAIDDISTTLEDISIFCNESQLRDYIAMVNGLVKSTEIDDLDNDLSVQSSSSAAPVNPAILTANQQADKLRELLAPKAFPNTNTDIVDAFNALEQTLKILTHIGCDTSCNYSARDMITINSLFYFHLQSGRQILGRLLIAKNSIDLKLANSLAHFTAFDTDKLATAALKTLNYDMLNFVIIHSQFAIDTFQMAENVNPAMYLIGLTNPQKIPDAAKCLAVLIRHGASLMICGASKLPIAYELLTSKHKAFHDVFINSFESEIALQLYLETLLKHFFDRLSAISDDTPLTFLSTEIYHLKLYIQFLKNLQFQDQDIPSSADMSFIDYVHKCKFQLFKLALSLPTNDRKKSLSELNSLTINAYLTAKTYKERTYQKNELTNSLYTLKREISRLLRRDKFQWHLTIFNQSLDPAEIIEKVRDDVLVKVQRLLSGSFTNK